MFMRFCACASPAPGQLSAASSITGFKRVRWNAPVQRLSTTSKCQATSSSACLNLASPANEYIRMKGSPDLLAGIHADSLQLWPDFLDEQEQETLLIASLKKLDDSTGSREERKRKRQWLKSPGARDWQSKFVPDDVYDWQPRHFDGVISSYRELNLSSWPQLAGDEADRLSKVLQKVYSLLPSGETADIGLAGPPHLLTHLLHLSSTGFILPHVDNIEASAGTIVGISLGAERDLVLEDGDNRIDIKLPAGSAYLQRGDIRYKWRHSIPAADPDDSLRKGQRLSVMIRDRHKPS